jgi:hypothetical protein
MPSPVDAGGDGDASGVAPQPAVTTAMSRLMRDWDTGRRPDVTVFVLVLEGGWTAHTPRSEGEGGRIPRVRSVPA